MLTWPDGRAASHAGVMIGTNDLSAVRCLNGTWGAGETAGMVMVVNTGEADAVLERGDLVAAARVDLQEPPPAPDEAGRRPDVAHIILQEDDLDCLFEVEMPSEEYYQERAAARRQDYPTADVHLLEHLDAIEPLLDLAILSGFSFGAAKAELAATSVKYLGDRVGRVELESLDLHTLAIREFPTPIPGLPELRRFFGVVNWCRKNFPAEFGQAAKGAMRYLKKGVVFPMDDAGEASIAAIKTMAAAAMRLSAIDELAALDGTRPQEQVADWSVIGWGGGIYQMSADRLTLHMLGQWSGACSASQSNYHSATGELFAQRRVRQEARRAVGRIPAYCWCDNSTGVGQATRDSASVDQDARSNRWIADIESDGSSLRSLSGRAMVIGDGLSRGPS
jgi:hypothetical protein